MAMATAAQHIHLKAGGGFGVDRMAGGQGTWGLPARSAFFGQPVGSFSTARIMVAQLPCDRVLKSIKSANGIVSMSLATEFAKETTVKTSELERIDPRTVVSVILGGGAGTRLFPLTKRRAKPAALAATQRPGEAGKNWFQGTADAVRQFHWLFEDARSKDIEDVLILSGDHLYRMDYMDFVQNHRNSGADITISCIPMDDSRASDFGLMKIDDKGQILFFSEKPKGADLKAMEVDTTVLGLSPEDAKKKPYIASMGVYVFKKEILLNLLRWRFPTANDFGSEIIPASAREYVVKAYLFDDYWEDIGTIKSFFEANLALTAQPPKFSFYDVKKPIYTSPRNLPPSKIDQSKIVESIVSHGCFLQDCSIEHSIIGIRSRILSGVSLKDTVMLGADYYETDAETVSLLAEGRVSVGIGQNTKIRNCIIDKNARIGKNVTIANAENVQEADRTADGFYIRSGITVVLKNSTIKDETVI
uniref:glucose-1-phosphate adenylyltransferase n=1 Tax=Wollemia nobilis TaxID=56998 RepID=A0A0C9RN64_9CONI